MSVRQPRDGEVGHLTIRAIYRAATSSAPASYEVEAPLVDHDGPITWLAVEEWLGDRTAGVVSFTPPPLPGESGSLILARVRSAGEPYLLSLGEHRDQPTWFVVGSLPYRSISTDLIDAWVQVDPGSLTTVVIGGVL